MKSNSTIKDIFFKVSAVLILVAAIIFYFAPLVAPWIMVFGVAGYASCTFTTPYPGKNIRGKRLFNMQIAAVILMAVATFLLFSGRTEWIILLFIASILTLYSTAAMSMAYKNEKEEENK